MSLHFVGVAEDLSLLATGVINKRFSFGTGVVKLFFSLLSIFHTLIDEIGTIVDPLEDGGPGAAPMEAPSPNTGAIAAKSPNITNSFKSLFY